MNPVRKIILSKDFKEEGTFKWYFAACTWLTNNGYSYGSTCIAHQVAIVKGEYNLPQKMKNMTTAQRKSVDGLMTSYDYREGIVSIVLFE